MADRTANPHRRPSAAYTFPIQRRPSAATTVASSARSPVECFRSHASSSSGHIAPAASYDERHVWSSAYGAVSIGSETLAARLPRSSTTHLTSSTPTSPRDLESAYGRDFSHPVRTYTAGEQDWHTSLARLRSHVSATNPAQPIASGASLNLTDTQSSRDSAAAIDPLSKHILERTSTSKSFPRITRAPSSQQHQESGTRRLSRPAPPGDIKKPRSFLRRFLHTKKKGRSAHLAPTSDGEDSPESPKFRSESRLTSVKRISGTDESQVQHTAADGYAYVPQYPDPPEYIKVRAHNRKHRDFDRLFVAQELQHPWHAIHNIEDPNAAASSAPATSDSHSASHASYLHDQQQHSPSVTGRAIWALQFSKSGRYLAAAGQDHKVKVWAVLASRHDRLDSDAVESVQSQQCSARLSAPVFKSHPVQVYEGHTASVVDLSWSKNDFLLSSSMDKTVRLWHASRSECLCVFKHNDFVTSITFHPKDDRFFLAGSLDMKLRLWSIPDKSIAYEAATPDMITAIAFTPDGKHAVAGLLNGVCIIYDTDGLKVLSRIQVGSSDHRLAAALHTGVASHRKRRQSAKGSKITGIDAIVLPPENSCAASGALKLLITSNDSRIRLFNFRDRTLEATLKGHENSTSQIRATFSPDGRYIISGSESRKAYIWPMHALGALNDGSDQTAQDTGSMRGSTSKSREIEFKSFEVFEAQNAAVTNAIMAPVRSKQILGHSGDIIYDLCNPPPVRLTSSDAREHDSAQYQPLLRRASGAERGESVTTCVPATASSGDSPSKGSMHDEDDLSGYMAPVSHPDGNVLVTSDTTGSIRVFRQDCGYWKRPRIAASAAAAIIEPATPVSGVVTGITGPADMSLAAQHDSSCTSRLSHIGLLRIASLSSRKSVSSASNRSAGVHRTRAGSRSSRAAERTSDLQSSSQVPDKYASAAAPHESRPDTALVDTAAAGTGHAHTPHHSDERILTWRNNIPTVSKSSPDGTREVQDPVPTFNDAHTESLSVHNLRGSSSNLSSDSHNLWNPSFSARFTSRERSREQLYQHHPYYHSRETSKSYVDDEDLPPNLEFPVRRDDDAVSTSSDKRSCGSMPQRSDAGFLFPDASGAHPADSGTKDFLAIPNSPLQRQLKPHLTSRSGFVTNAGMTPLSPPSTTGDRDTFRDSTSVNRESMSLNDEVSAAASDAPPAPTLDSRLDGEPQGRLGAGLAASALWWTRLAAQALTARRPKLSLNLPELTVSGTNGTNTPLNSAPHSPAASATQQETEAGAQAADALTTHISGRPHSVGAGEHASRLLAPEMHNDLSNSRSLRGGAGLPESSRHSRTHLSTPSAWSESSQSEVYDEDDEVSENGASSVHGSHCSQRGCDEDEVVCANCGYNDFRAMRNPQRLICSKCGTVMS